MAADFYYNDYAFRRNPSRGLRNEREEIIAKAQKIKIKRNKKSFAAISMLLLMSVILIYLYGQLMEVNYSLTYNRNRLNTLSVNNEELRASISSTLTADQIRNYARETFGMNEPSGNQIRYLTLKQSDTTLMCAPSNDNKSAFDFLLSIFK